MRSRLWGAIIALLAVMAGCSKNEYTPKPSVQLSVPGLSPRFDDLKVGEYGVYRLLSNTNGTVEVANASVNAGSTYDVNTYTGSAFQKWKITNVAPGYFTIMNVGSSLYAESYNYNNIQVILQAPANGSDAQQWSLALISPSTYKAINKADGLAVTCNGDATLQLQPFSNLPGQIFGSAVLPAVGVSGIPERRTPVYFGTVDEGPKLDGDGQMAKLSDPANYSQWEYVRTHADGYVQCFITMDGNNHRATPLANLQAMAAAFTNKGCYYAASTETSVQASGDPESDAVDRANIDSLIKAGFNVTSAAINYGTNPTRTATLRTYKGTRPCLQLWGPWGFGGDINSNYSANALVRSDILATDGISFDGPMGLWYGDLDQMREGAYSAVAFAHANGKLASMDPAPSGFFGDPNYAPPATNFFPTAKSCVMSFEDHNDALDEWDLYLYQYSGTPIFPEVTVQNGTNVPANSQTGFAYWLIRHLNTLPQMSVAYTGNVANNTMVTADNTHAQITMNTKGDTTTTYSMKINFSNKPDTAIELSPVISAAVTGSTADWQVSFNVGTTDVTSYVLGTGLNCVGPARLHSNFTFPLTMTVKALTPTAQPISINFVTAANISNTGNKLKYSVVAQTQ